MEKLAINVKELAELLNISIPTAYQLTERSDFPCVRISKKRKIIPLDALKKYLNEQAGR